MKTYNNIEWALIEWVLEYRCYDLSPWSRDTIIGHATKEDVFKKGRMFIADNGGEARACNIMTGEAIDIYPELALA